MKKRHVLVVCVVLAVLVGAAIFTLTGHRGPQGAATGSSGGCGGDPADPLVTEQSEGLALARTTAVAVVTGSKPMHAANAQLHNKAYELDKVEKNLGVADQSLSEVRLSSFKVQLTEDALAKPDDTDDLGFVESMVVYVRSSDPESTLDERAVAWFYREESPESTDDALVFEVDAGFDFAPYLDPGFELFAKADGGVPMDDVSFNGSALFIGVPAQP